MTPHDLGPAFIRYDYTSQWGPHSMTIPSVPVTGAGDVNPFFTLRGLESPVSVESAVTDFANLLKVMFLPSTTIQNATMFTKAGVGDPAIPRNAWTLNIAGTNGGGALQNEAVQQTFSFRTQDFNPFKLVILDGPVVADHRPVVSFGSGTAEDTIIDYITADESWFAGRDGAAVKTFLKRTITENEKLRRSYRMT